MESTFFTRREEIVNALTHGVGTGLAIAALPILIVFSSLRGGIAHVVGFSVFGLSLVVLYITSTLYHGVSDSRLKATFRKLDHMSIFLLIAGSYTPFCLTALPGWIGWTVLAIVWICALLGMVIKIFHTGHQERLSTFFYILMGWLIIPAIDPLYHAMTKLRDAFARRNFLYLRNRVLPERPETILPQYLAPVCAGGQYPAFLFRARASERLVGRSKGKGYQFINS